MDDERQGLVYGASAYLLWGIFPLYFPLLKPAGTIEILAMRMAWSLIVMLVVLRVGGHSTGVRQILHNRRQLVLLALAAGLVTCNWGTYVYGVNSGHVVETSLGYFINPLITILLAVIFLRERLRRAQWVAVAIGVVAVGIITVDYGHLPWIALVLAFSFGLYGFCKKQANAGAVESMAVETGVQIVPALIAIAAIAANGNLVFGTRTPTSFLLAGLGLITVVPLLFFAAGTRRLPLSVIGLLQYLAPVLQFAVGVGIRHEDVPGTELVGFCLVWVALIVLSVDGVRHQRAGRRPEQSADSVAA
ncbi:EamA family transporter RarD [uncultured Jatrophihabitans sp.]|uniref:EamA family transporter RarD n=1 Tax=uncultured Jatrophihabitans sp. TaxID=1610747 RepID=UPI0035CAD35B